MAIWISNKIETWRNANIQPKVPKNLDVPFLFTSHGRLEPQRREENGAARSERARDCGEHQTAGCSSGAWVMFLQMMRSDVWRSGVPWEEGSLSQEKKKRRKKRRKKKSSRRQLLDGIGLKLNSQQVMWEQMSSLLLAELPSSSSEIPIGHYGGEWNFFNGAQGAETNEKPKKKTVISHYFSVFPVELPSNLTLWK